MMASAPTLQVARRDVVAVEHPMIVNNLDNAIKTFGVGFNTTGRPFRRLIDVEDPEGSIPLYIRYDDPLCAPILSHNSSTNNILLKVTVPKRTGRKRKRGSQEPYSGSPIATEQEGPTAIPPDLRSHSRLDNPVELLRTLKDNVGKYEVEAVGEIDRTHRFRGLADFHQSTSNTEFMSKYTELACSGQVEKLRQFKFNLSKGWKPNEEFVPPPVLTNHVLPFNWGWHQNPHIIQTVNQATGEVGLLNRSRSRKFQIEYLSHDAEHTPTAPPTDIPDDPELLSLIDSLNEALEERPLWTRRALSNRVGHSPYLYLLKPALQYVGYQFKGGPFRDAVIKFGVDPRSDPKYRMYQTIFFKLYEEDDDKGPFRKWHDNRTTNFTKRTRLTNLTTHVFDGKSLTLDGKIWQYCDITDPYLVQLIQNAPVCKEFNSNGPGYFYSGSWSKIRAVMKLKLTAIRLGKTIDDEDFENTIHKIPDIVDDPKKANVIINVPVPDIKLTEEEFQKLEEAGFGNLGGNKWKTDGKGNARKIRLRDQRINERRTRTTEHDRSSAQRSMTPTTDMPTLDPALRFSGQDQVGGVEAKDMGREQFRQYLDAYDEEYGPDDEDYGDSDLDDYQSQDEDDEGNGSDGADGPDFSRSNVPRTEPAGE